MLAGVGCAAAAGSSAVLLSQSMVHHGTSKFPLLRCFGWLLSFTWLLSIGRQQRGLGQPWLLRWVAGRK